MSKLWYKNKANIWEEALPLGNGRLGAMVFGGIEHEQIQLNEESMWYGALADRINPDAKENLPTIRKLIFAGRIPEAERLMKYALSGCPESQHPYQSLGNIYLTFYGIGQVSSYTRTLDLNTATYEQVFGDEDTAYSRRIFISKPADIMVIHLKANGKKKLNFDAILRRERFFDGVHKIGENGISLYGNLGKGGFDFQMCLTSQVKNGSVKVIGEHIVVSNADEAILYFSADTSYHVDNELSGDLEDAVYKRIIEAESRKISELYDEHVTDYKSLFDTVELKINEETDYDALPTDERLQKASSKSGPDAGLSKLYFDYGRYLLISCSREGTLPANLQGIWNKDMLPPWDSKYTININAQMNYWPAESCNLSSCHKPLFELTKKLAENGKRTAKLMYGCKGWVAHHNTDIWADTAPQDIWNPSTYWVMGGAWLCTHLWNHYEYTLDKAFLEEYYPIIKGCVEFFMDYLVEKNGYMVTCPSVSPENTFKLPSGVTGANIYGVTMDNQILRDLFSEYINAAAILGKDSEYAKSVEEMKNKLIPTKIASNGTIMEWPEEYEEIEIGHRHISHLYGLYPSDQISVDGSPLLAEAAKATLERRLSCGGGHTGWSRAWIINMYAKLWDKDKAYENLKALFAISTYPNMFDKHPPFQIDGNFGATAAIANMIVQSSMNRIVLLPALPKEWKNGSVKGLKLKGCGEIAISWKNGKIVDCTIVFEKSVTKTILFGEYKESISFEANVSKHIKQNKLGKVKVEE